jgi:hypothetical protein
MLVEVVKGCSYLLVELETAVHYSIYILVELTKNTY